MSSRVPVRYVVLGLVADTEAWRRERGLSRREVLSVSTRDPSPLRGMTVGPECCVIELPSWSCASARTRDEFTRNLVIAGLSYQKGMRDRDSRVAVAASTAGQHDSPDLDPAAG